MLKYKTIIYKMKNKIKFVFFLQVGVCKMGPETDPTAVVDHKLRVHGIKQLRVIDSGIIPSPTTGHVGAYAFLIGERGADFIKETWNS